MITVGDHSVKQMDREHKLHPRNSIEAAKDTGSCGEASVERALLLPQRTDAQWLPSTEYGCMWLCGKSHNTDEMDSELEMHLCEFQKQENQTFPLGIGGRKCRKW